MKIVLFSLFMSTCMLCTIACKQNRSATSVTVADKPEKDYAEPPHIDLVNVHWVLREAEGQPVKPQQDVFIRFLENETVQGFGGCNKFNGRYTSNGASIHIGPLMSTKMACEDMDIENKFFSLLEQAVSYTTDSKYMYLKDGKGSLLAKLEAVYM